MHDRGDHETNVVHLRRRDEPAEAEREWLASTIFAEEDDVGPFSRGNLVPPRRAPDAEPTSPPTERDPFFDDLTTSGTSDGSPAGAGDAVDDTDAYFDRIRAQSPVEMAESASPAVPADSLPGSARMPAEPRPRHRLRRRAGWIVRTVGGPREARSSSGERGTGAKIRGLRLAAAGRNMRPLGAMALCLVLLGSGVVIVASAGSGGAPSAGSIASTGQGGTVLGIASDPFAGYSASSSRTYSSAGSPAPSTTTSASSSGSNTNAGEQTTSPAQQPAFGANGALGPGSSPDS